MQTVAETPTSSRQADKLFREEEKRELIDYLGRNPLAGDEIPGTGGVRKLRYAKADRTDLMPAERRGASALASALKATVKETG